MMQCGIVWRGMVQYGVVWYGMVWYGVVQYCMVWCRMVQSDKAQYIYSITNSKKVGKAGEAD